jgi:hypothetical protein
LVLTHNHLIFSAYSAYLDKGKEEHYMKHACGEYDNYLPQSFEDFADLVIRRGCFDRHWESQTSRIGDAVLPFINFVGHFTDEEGPYEDAKKLLERVGIWDRYAATGWGEFGNSSLFSNIQRVHVTSASDHLREFYTPELERLVEDFYIADYDNPLFGFQRLSLFHNTTNK